MSDKQQLRVLSEQVLASTPWVLLKEKQYQRNDGSQSAWAYIERCRSRRAVVMIPLTRESGSLILIRQFRVPFSAEVIEFPAGLVDNEEALETAALRELVEETGYKGHINSVGPAVASTPGLSSELVHMVEMDVEEEPSAPQKLEVSEQIDVLRISPEDVDNFLAAQAEEGLIIDTKVYIFLQSFREVRSP